MYVGALKEGSMFFLFLTSSWHFSMLFFIASFSYLLYKFLSSYQVVLRKKIVKCSISFFYPLRLSPHEGFSEVLKLNKLNFNFLGVEVVTSIQQL